MHCRGGPEWPPPQQAEYNKPAGQLLRRTHYFRTQQKNCLGTRPRQFKRCEQYFYLPECPSPAFRYKKTVKQAKSYSPAKQIAVPSALEGLTSGFGMGPGGPPPLFSPASTALSKLVKRSYRSLYSPLQLVSTLSCPLRFRISSARDFEQNGS